MLDVTTVDAATEDASSVKANFTVAVKVEFVLATDGEWALLSGNERYQSVVFVRVEKRVEDWECWGLSLMQFSPQITDNGRPGLSSGIAC